MANEIIASKHNKARTIPISPRLAATLANLPRRGLWVLVRPDGGALAYDVLFDEIAGLYQRAGEMRSRGSGVAANSAETA